MARGCAFRRAHQGARSVRPFGAAPVSQSVRSRRMSVRFVSAGLLIAAVVLATAVSAQNSASPGALIARADSIQNSNSKTALALVQRAIPGLGGTSADTALRVRALRVR